MIKRLLRPKPGPSPPPWSPPPYSQDNKRGLSANLLIVDEAGFVKEDLYMSTLIPLLTERNCTMVALTTPGESQHYIMRAQKYVDKDGVPVIKYVDIGLMCEDCQKLTDKHIAIQCKHLPWLIPDTIDEEKREKANILYQENLARAYKELYGISSANDQLLFAESTIDHFLSYKNLVSLSIPVEEVFIFHDPSGGGKSLHAFSAFIQARDHRVVRPHSSPESSSSASIPSRRCRSSVTARCCMNRCIARVARVCIRLSGGRKLLRTRVVWNMTKDQMVMRLTLSSGWRKTSSG